MKRRDETSSSEPAEQRGPGYEPPRVETVLTPAELEREVLYAGVPPSVDTGG